jgi:AraC family transcriptional regulator, regulatory protein of adaptative response / DNA-3-methyladenine glycosylase II
MSHEQMYARFAASDPAWNGRFFTGVLTTGIYCLPSCHARKARPENVRFFPSCESAREAGLRPCRKCHPDDYARGADPLLETIEDVVREVRRAPQAFSDARAIVRRSGFGSTRCFELFRQHFHATPAEMLLRARLDAACALLVGSDRGLAPVAEASGFESLSAFHERFRERTGMTPAHYRALRRGGPFTLQLPDDYCLGHVLRTLGRDAQSLNERLDGRRYETAMDLAGVSGVVRVDFGDGAARVEVLHPRTPTLAQQLAAHRGVVALLGLDQDAAGFVKLARRLGLARLVAGRTGFRLVRTPGVYDGLLWCIIGQQINLPFACTLKRRLVEGHGRPIAGGLWALPRPEVLAGLEPGSLRPLQYSQQKAEYLIGVSRKITEGSLDLDALAMFSATRAERTLGAVRGLGPWSVNYLMMRSLGFADCVPLGDTGVTSGLITLFKLDERPDTDATQRLMSVFSPHRSLATAHLWQINQPPP